MNTCIVDRRQRPTFRDRRADTRRWAARIVARAQGLDDQRRTDRRATR